MSTMRGRWLGILVTLTLVPGAVPRALAAPSSPTGGAEADAAYVRTVVARVAAHVEARRYERALAVLDDAERTRPHAVFVYVRATIEERRGDCERAAELYLRFLELDVPDDDAEDARRGVARCRGEAPASDPDGPAEASDEPEAAPVGPAPSSLDPDASDEPPPRPWVADPWGGALIASGVVGVGVGVGLVAQSRSDARATASATSLQTFDELSRRAIRLNAAGIATLAVGSALLLGGVLRYALVGTRPRRQSRVQATTTGLTLRF